MARFISLASVPTHGILGFVRTHARTDGRDLLAYGVLAFALAMLPAAVAFGLFLLAVGTVCAVAAGVAAVSSAVRDQAGRLLWAFRVALADTLHALGDTIDPRAGSEPPDAVCERCGDEVFACSCTLPTLPPAAPPPAAVPVAASTASPAASEHVEATPPPPAAHRHLWCGANCHSEPFRCRCPGGNDEPAEPVAMPAAAQVTTAPEPPLVHTDTATAFDRIDWGGEGEPAPDTQEAFRIAVALHQHGSIRGAARALGIADSTLRWRMKKLGVPSPKAKARGRAGEAAGAAA
jgi:hypothetical protein